MNVLNKTKLQFSNLSLAYGDKILFDSISGSILEKDKIGLIGINGSGKSSLLKILAGINESKKGFLVKAGTVEYVAQLDLELYRRKIPLYQYVEETIDEWWFALSEYKKLFNKSLEENRIINTLSGGELVKLNISIALMKKPDILLLDEPTNHLDLGSLKELENLLNNISIPFVLVSHNVNFLNKVVKTIWEIDNQKITVYGGNYDFYSEQKKINWEAKSRLYEEKRKELKKLKRSEIQERKRAQRSQKVGKEIGRKHDRSTDRFATGFFKNSSEKSGAKRKVMFDDKKNELEEKLKKLKSIQRKNIHLDLQTSMKSGLIISISNGKITLPDNTVLIDQLDFGLYHKDRFAIFGDNGSGKTTFVKQLIYKNHPLLSGDIKEGFEYKTLYVDQKYDLIKPEQSVVENIKSANLSISYENIRKILGNMNFSDDFDINKKAKDLSGGETARLAFAIATNSSIDLLVLDEPTNNLDIETVDTISYALKLFEGALVIISHDIDFIEKIGIENILEIKNKILRF